MFWTKKAKVEIPKDLEDIILEQYKTVQTKPWTKDLKLESNNAATVLYQLIFRESKGRNIPITQEEIYKLVEKLEKKVTKAKPEKTEVGEETTNVIENPVEVETPVHLEEEKKASLKTTAAFQERDIVKSKTTPALGEGVIDFITETGNVGVQYGKEHKTYDRQSAEKELESSTGLGEQNLFQI